MRDSEDIIYSLVASVLLVLRSDTQKLPPSQKLAAFPRWQLFLQLQRFWPSAGRNGRNDLDDVMGILVLAIQTSILMLLGTEAVQWYDKPSMFQSLHVQPFCARLLL